MHGEEESRHLLESREEATSILLPPAHSADTCRLLISLDYDGTLRHEGEERVPPAFFELVHDLRRHGVRWGINTGRSLRKLAGELEHFPTTPDFICTCERYAYLADAGGRLTPAEAHNACCHKANLALRRSILPDWQSALARLRRLHPGCKWEPAADDPLSIEAEGSATLDILMPHLTHLAQGDVAIQRAGRFMRLSDARFTKGSALRYVQQAWQVPEHGLFIMGDGHNDIDAFRLFPKAFCAAPSTAHPDVLHWLSKHGGYLSPEPGVLQALHHWCTLQGIPVRH